MSLSEALAHARKLGILAATVTAVSLSACSDGTGFRPVYGNFGTSAEVDSKLAQIEMATIPGRVGQRVRNELIFQTTGGQNPLSPAYRLEIVLTESLTSTLVQRDGDSLSQIYALNATFRLVNINDRSVVLQGTSFGRAGFERFTSVLANVRAREDAENRAATTVATDIRGRLAAFLSRPA
jgi:LPS-assembly lipoprotein